MTMRATVHTGFTILISVRELEAGWTSRAGGRFFRPARSVQDEKEVVVKYPSAAYPSTFGSSG